METNVLSQNSAKVCISNIDGIIFTITRNSLGKFYMAEEICGTTIGTMFYSEASIFAPVNDVTEEIKKLGLSLYEFKVEFKDENIESYQRFIINRIFGID